MLRGERQVNSYAERIASHPRSRRAPVFFLILLIVIFYAYGRWAIANYYDAAIPHYDYILIDTAPVLSANDALDLARSADGIVLVCRFKQTTASGGKLATETMQAAGVPMLGIVLAAVRGGEGYGYYYGGYYSAYQASYRPTDDV